MKHLKWIALVVIVLLISGCGKNYEKQAKNMVIDIMESELALTEFDIRYEDYLNKTEGYFDTYVSYLKPEEPIFVYLDDFDEQVVYTVADTDDLSDEMMTYLKDKRVELMAKLDYPEWGMYVADPVEVEDHWIVCVKLETLDDDSELMGYHWFRVRVFRDEPLITAVGQYVSAFEMEQIVDLRTMNFDKRIK